MKFSRSTSLVLSFLMTGAMAAPSVQIGDRPYWLVNEMEDSPLKQELATCASTMETFAVSDFSIGHRGACMQYPEHTIESYTAAIIQGAGIVECDVTFTQDLELVCRHDQCDLHTTTDVVTRPELNAKCTTPWSTGVAPRCCTSDFTLAEIKTLCAKMDSSNDVNAATAEGYAFGGTAAWRTDVHQSGCPAVPTHAESIALMKSHGIYFTPELKSPAVEMPFNGYTQEMYAQAMVDEYTEAGVPPSQVWPQSFNEADVYYWVDNTDFGAQAVSLDGVYERNETEIDAYLDRLVDGNVSIVAPPMWRLVDPDDTSDLKLKASYYANAAKERNLSIITWTLERTDPGLQGWYWQTANAGGLELTDGDKYNLLEVLNKDVGILGIFSDWPATVTFYANCKGMVRAAAENPTEPPEEGSMAFRAVASWMMGFLVYLFF